MKQFLLLTAAFFIIMAAIDFGFGVAMDNIASLVKRGRIGRDNYIANECCDDLLVLGSSRAEFHYNTSLMTDSLGIPCFNCGEGGCGCITAYGMLDLVEERHIPKYIIYEITPKFDYLTITDNHQFLQYLKPYYSRADIDQIFADVDRKESLKMLSGFYRNNTTFIRNLLFVAIPNISSDDGVRGFRPRREELDPLKIRVDELPEYNSEEYPEFVYDSVKMKYLNKIVAQRERGVKVIIVASPSWYGTTPEVLDTVRTMCREHDIPFYDYSNSPKYVHQNEYFADGLHLNARGADEFTRDIIKQLKKEGMMD